MMPLVSVLIGQKVKVGLTAPVNFREVQELNKEGMMVMVEMSADLFFHCDL